MKIPDCLFRMTPEDEKAEGGIPTPAEFEKLINDDCWGVTLIRNGVRYVLFDSDKHHDCGDDDNVCPDTGKSYFCLANYYRERIVGHVLDLLVYHDDEVSIYMGGHLFSTDPKKSHVMGIRWQARKNGESIRITGWKMFPDSLVEPEPTDQTAETKDQVSN